MRRQRGNCGAHSTVRSNGSPELRKDGLLPELTGVKSYQPAEFKEKVDWMMERGFLAEAPDYKDVVRSK